MRPLRLRAQLYRQFDADPTRAVPAETYGGWHEVDVELAPEHTALVVMHAWDCGAPEEFPGWRRAVEYYGRAEGILAGVFPPLLAAVRRSTLPVFHVVGGGKDYYSHLPGYRHAIRLAGDAPPAPPAITDPVHDHLRRIRASESFPGTHNAPDIAAGFARLDFAPAARPLDSEGVAENAAQLAALARERGVNHLIYVGFAINWCLLMSPGGMVDMGRLGFLCSTVREAVTAVENAETARDEREKAQALWRVAVEFGFVFGLTELLGALSALERPDRFVGSD
jgi:nicotinamidase-related amidase